jgi:hypothetical protein
MAPQLRSGPFFVIVGLLVVALMLLEQYQLQVNNLSYLHSGSSTMSGSSFLHHHLYLERVGSDSFDGYFAGDIEWYERYSQARVNLTSRARNIASLRKFDNTNSSSPTFIPVIGVTVFKDVDNYLQRLLDSVDIKVGKVVVTWYGYDDQVANVLSYHKNNPLFELIINHYPTNMGCAFGFNEAILSSIDETWWLIANSDIAYPQGILANIARTVNGALASDALLPEQVFAIHTFTFQYGPANLWSNFAITKNAVSKVGFFDENLYPAFWEDADYGWRTRKVCEMRL